MSFADAVRIIAARRHFPDIDAALALVGYRLSEVVDVDDELPADVLSPGMQEMVDRVRLRKRRRAPVAQHARSGHHRSPVGPGLSWDWGAGATPARLGRAAREQRESGAVETPDGFIPCVRAPRTVVAPAHDAATLVELRIPYDLTGPTHGDVVDVAPRDDSEAAGVADPVVAGWARFRSAGARIDVARVVDRLARLQPLHRVPYRERTRQARSVQLVLDIGLRQGPFGDDLHALVAQVRRTLPSTDLTELQFADRLGRGCGTGPIWTWRPYRLPAVPCVSIVVSGSWGADPVGRRRELDGVLAALNRRRGLRAHGLWFGDPGDEPEPARRSGSRWTVVTE